MNNTTKKRPCDFCKQPLDLIRESENMTVYSCPNGKCPITILEIQKMPPECEVPENDCDDDEYDEYGQYDQLGLEDDEDELEEVANG